MPAWKVAAGRPQAWMDNFMADSMVSLLCTFHLASKGENDEECGAG
jgi:hypothetical protein